MNTINEGFALSPQQKKWWESNKSECQEKIVVRLAGLPGLDFGKLKDAFESAYKEHEALQTRVLTLDKNFPILTLAADSCIKFQLIDTVEPGAADKYWEGFISENADLDNPVAVTFFIEHGFVAHIFIRASTFVCDAHSLQVMLARVQSVYCGDSIPCTPLQYPDVAEYMSELLEVAESKPFISTLQEKIAMPPLVGAPFFSGAINAQKNEGNVKSNDIIEVEVNDFVMSKLHQFSQAHSVSVEILFISTIYALFYKQSKECELSVSYQFSGRLHEELNEVIGLFSKNIPLLVRLNPEESFLDLINNVRAKYDEIKSLQEYFSPSSSGFGNNDVVVSVHDFGVHCDRSTSLLINKIWYLEKYLLIGSLNPIKFEFVKYNNWVLQLHCAKNSMLPGYGNIIAAQMISLLENALHNPDCLIGDLVLPTPYDQIIETMGANSKIEEGRPKNLLASFLNHVEKSPLHVAVKIGENKISYADINIHVNQLANYINSLSLPTSQTIAISIKRSPELIIAILAIYKAGHHYLPIDPDIPEVRARYMLSDSAAALCIVDDSTQELFKAIDIKIHNVSNFYKFDFLQYDSTYVDIEPEDNDLAYIMYTSGSTGTPKGVMITHKGLNNYLAFCKKEYPLVGNGASILHSSIGFDATITTMLAPIYAGGCILALPEKNIEELAGLLELPVDYGVIKITPSHMAAIQEMRNFSSLKANVSAFVIGGEVLNSESVFKWKAVFPKARFINEYGPTETVVGCTIYDVKDKIIGHIPIGKPIDNMEVLILDSQLKPVSVGCIGEIYISGEGLALGYRNLLNQTMDRFIAHPLVQNIETKLYKTGDLAYYLPDGNIVCIGRADSQVKINGYRIELDEIEKAIAAFEDGCSARVIAHKTAAGRETLIAFITRQLNKNECPLERLHKHIAARLPSYMQPAKIILVEHFPTTVNGKLDTEALSSIYEEHIQQRRIDPPITHFEKILVDIWCEVLGLENIGINENFFSLGGDSILSIRVVTRANKVGIKISSNDFYEAQTISLLAELADKKSQIEPQEIVGAILPFEIDGAELAKRYSTIGKFEDAYPLTSMQWAMLAFSQFDKKEEYSSYVDVSSYRITGKFDSNLFANAISEIVYSNEILRTCVLTLEDGTPYTFVRDRASFSYGIDDIKVTDICGLDEHSQNGVIFDFLEGKKREKFDVSTAPLFKFYVHILSNDCTVLTFSRHHLILDGWSTAVLLSNAFHLYEKLSRGENIKLSSYGGLSFKQYVAREARSLRDEKIIEYWKARLACGVSSKIPASPYYSRSAVGRRLVKSIVISNDLSNRLKDMAKMQSVHVKTVLLAAHMKTLSLLTGESVVSTGLVINNRLDYEGGDEALGLFLNTLPFYINASTSDWLELISAISKEEADSSFAKSFPLNNLQVMNDGQNLFHTLFNFVNFHAYRSVGEASTFAIDTIFEYEKVNYPFVVYSRINVKNNNIELDIHFDPTIYPEQQIEIVAGYYSMNLEQMTLAESKPELKSIAPDFNKIINLPSGTLDNNYTVHELVIKQALAEPDLVAVRDNDRVLTYRDLLIEATGIAISLQKNGIQKGGIVAVMLARGYRQVTALLGVLFSGAAYLPISPSSPIDRTNEILKLSGAGFIITEFNNASENTDKYECNVIDLSALDVSQTLDVDFLSGVSSDPSSLAYVIYTSGSTGAPKGVAIEHNAVVNTLIDMNRRFGISSDDVAIGISELTFDLSVYDIFGMLICGGSLVIVAEKHKRDPEYWIALARQFQITVWNSVPALLDMLVSYLENFYQNDSRLPFRNIWMSGDTILPSLPDRIKSFCNDDVQVVSLGGATEVSIWSIYYPINDRSSEWGSIPYGRPLSNQEIYVLDENLAPCSPLLSGDIYIGGAGLARCYWNDDTRTEQSFIYHHQLKRRLYRTGDRGRWLHDGQVEFLGRLDNQIKINGFRVELGEIEIALKKHPLIKNAVVTLMVEDEKKYIISYVVSDEGIDKNECSRFLKKLLPTYMIPSYYVFLDSFPITENGKINRSNLPAPERDLKNDDELIPPVTPTEYKMWDIWTKMLSVKNIGINSNFFDVGGNSLLAMKLVALIKDEMNIHISVTIIFESPNLQSICSYIDAILVNRENENLHIDAYLMEEEVL
ncbi:non-ribosomal peptide synthetase [Cellvibrio mixtus]|uniref:non-ribosomal peptide synthetase n=1 Tax=Cellvibrio mixtus TaxID=39650 RepID=UPI0005871CB5|nr:non-ribosomal peptide synthetase [Cellvibrio mixtus]